MPGTVVFPISMKCCSRLANDQQPKVLCFGFRVEGIRALGFSVWAPIDL